MALVTRTAPPHLWAPRLHRTRYEPEPGQEPAPADVPAARIGVPAGPGHTATAALRAQLSELLRVALEVFDGRRPLAQLSAGFTDRSLRYWRALPAVQPRSPIPSRLVRMRIDRPHAHVAEVAAVITVADRHRALPARFERGADRVWRCTDIRIL